MIAKFAHPAYLNYIWILIIFFFLVSFYLNRKTAKFKKVLGEKTFSFLTQNASFKGKKLKLILRALALIFFVIALARPQSGEKKSNIKSEGIELMILFDVSRSMMAEDIRPSRLEMAKKEVERFIKKSGSNKVGILAFAGTGILLSPMTTDKSAINMYLDSLSIDAVSTQGTEFKSALLAAQEAFNRGGVESDDSVVTRAIIIVSDGEDNEPGAIKAAEDLVEQGIHIFSLGFGTEEGGKIPIKDRYGNTKTFYKDKSGNVVVTKTKGTVLKELAEKGGGSFYPVDYGNGAIEALIQDLKNLEQTEFETADLTQYDENFQIFLIIALLIALFEVLISERKKIGRIWRGRFEVNKN